MDTPAPPPILVIYHQTKAEAIKAHGKPAIDHASALLVPHLHQGQHYHYQVRTLRHHVYFP